MTKKRRLRIMLLIKVTKIIYFLSLKNSTYSTMTRI
jgi:hypothetical protein